MDVRNIASIFPFAHWRETPGISYPWSEVFQYCVMRICDSNRFAMNLFYRELIDLDFLCWSYGQYMK